MATIAINDRFVYVKEWHATKCKKLVVLHGFTGSTATWEAFADQYSDAHIIAIDLIGHGKSDAPEQAARYEMHEQLQLIEHVLAHYSITKCNLLGYSMGGRIALSFAVKYPQYIETLILESASPGLSDEVVKAERFQSDNELANFIEQQGIHAFVQKWENIPLFATQKSLQPQIQQQIRQERLQQRPHGIANSLRGIGTGIMPSLWHELSKLEMPIHLIVGQIDEKFVRIAHEMKKSLKNAQIYEIPGCGHAIHVENLSQFATIVKESISKH